MWQGFGIYKDGERVEAGKELPACPECGELLFLVWEYVTEQRKYSFSLTHNEYVGYSDPVDDTSTLDYVLCPNCFEALPQSFVERLFELFDAFTTSP
jgi:hypothetical protein